MRKEVLVLIAFVVPALGFAPLSPLCITSSSVTSPRAASPTSRLWSTPEPLATEGDWSAYLDNDRTGYVYYFNGVTGESLWEPPTTTFPFVMPGATTTTTDTSVAESTTKEDRRAERQMRREQKKLDLTSAVTVVETTSSNSEENKGVGRGALFGLFGGNKDATITTSSKAQQLLALGKITNKDEFLSDVDAVIAEAEEAIAIAAKVNEKEEKPENVFTSVLLGLNLGATRTSSKEKGVVMKEDTPLTTATTSTTMSEAEEKKKATFFPGTTNEKKKETKVVVAVETPNKEKKAKVSDSDFLDEIWGAETSARPTLKIAEMMKLFQVRSTEIEVRGPTAAKKSIEFRTLTLDAALEVRAHPEKVSWGGEDAGFIVGRTFGVFDGVSGATKEKGKKLYSRCLTNSMKKTVAKTTTSGGGEKKVSAVREMTDYLIEARNLPY